MTTVKDTITYADGTLASGRIWLTWPSFQSLGATVSAGQSSYLINPDGTISINLYPNLGAQPEGTYYTVAYALDKGPVYREYWVVPSLPVVSIGEVRTIPEMITN
jgi:hypothetical protein